MKKTLIIIVLFLLVAGFGLVVANNQSVGPTAISPANCGIFQFKLPRPEGSVRGRVKDGYIVAHVKQMQKALEFYNEAHGTYPIVTLENTNDAWGALGTELTPKYVTQLPIHPCVVYESEDHQYVYRSSPSGDTYVFRAILISPDEYTLSPEVFDVDGEILGVNCNDAIDAYCVVPQESQE